MASHNHLVEGMCGTSMLLLKMIMMKMTMAENEDDCDNDSNVAGALPAAEQAEVPPIKPWQPHQAHHPQPLRERSQGQHHHDDGHDYNVQGQLGQ